MFIVIKSEHYDCTNLICKKDTLEEAVAAVKDSMAQRINKNYHAGLTGTDITHENEDHYGFSFTFDENRNADSSEPRAYSTYDYWNGDDQESVEWVVYEVTTDKPFFLLSYEEYESIELTGFYDSFDEAFEEMKELIAESVNDVFDEDATADDVEDIQQETALLLPLRLPPRQNGHGLTCRAMAPRVTMLFLHPSPPAAGPEPRPLPVLWLKSLNHAAMQRRALS